MRHPLHPSCNSPPAKGVSTGLTGQMIHCRCAVDRGAQNGRAETRHEGACVTTGVTLHEEERTTLQGEATAGEPPQASSEQSLQPAANVPTGKGQCLPAGREPRPTIVLLVREPPAALEEHVLGVGPLDDETHQIPELFVGDLPPSLRLVLIAADLALHDIAQPQPPGHGDGRVLLLENLGGSIMRPNDLQKREGDHRRDPWASVGGRLVSLAVAHCDGFGDRRSSRGSVSTSPGAAWGGRWLRLISLSIPQPATHPSQDTFRARTDMRVTSHCAGRI